MTSPDYTFSILKYFTLCLCLLWRSKHKTEILKPFLGAITISAYSLCERNRVPRINAVLSFVWSIRRVQNKYQQTKQVNRKHDNHCYSFYFREAKCKGPIFGPLLSELRWNIFSTISEERKARVRISDPYFLIRDEIFFPLPPREAKSKGLFCISASFNYLRWQEIVQKLRSS